MSSQQKAYLVIHKLAWYNDAWYTDFTAEMDIANPAGLYATLAEAELAVARLTRQRVRGAFHHDLLLDEAGSNALLTLLSDSTNEFAPMLKNCLSGGAPLPATLTDSQADAIIQLLQVQLFHVLQADLDPDEVSHAQRILTETPDHPVMPATYSEEGRAVEEFDGDEAAQRLNRVTQLFGRVYGTEIPV